MKNSYILACGSIYYEFGGEEVEKNIWDINNVPDASAAWSYLDGSDNSIYKVSIMQGCTVRGFKIADFYFFLMTPFFNCNPLLKLRGYALVPFLYFDLSTSAYVLRHLANLDFLLVEKYRSNNSFGRSKVNRKGRTVAYRVSAQLKKTASM